MFTTINFKNKLLFFKNYSQSSQIIRTVDKKCDRIIIFNTFIPDGWFEKEILCLLFTLPNSLFQHSFSKNNLFLAAQKQTNYSCLRR